MCLLFKFSLTAFLLSLAAISQAVSLSNMGHGEVLIYPYYTVNNELNTIYSMVNTTDQAKAVKVRFLEGEAGREALEFNVYLSPHDVWTAGLTATNSTFNGHVGEPSVLHITTDTSCAPFLNKMGQEFVPFEIEKDFSSGNTTMRRATDGHIEVIEMGVVTNANNGSATALTHDHTGIPNNCVQLRTAWEASGYWLNNPTTDLASPTGGLFGSAAIVDVQDGISFNYEAVALEDFWLGMGLHAEPGSLQPNLANASTQSNILIDGVFQTSNWISGYEAVSAILMQTTIFNEFSYEAAVLGKTEWVINFPTKFYHTVPASSPPPFVAIQPFEELWNGYDACEEYLLTIWNRNARKRLSGVGIAPLPPEGANPSFCYQTNVIEFASDNQPLAAESSILGSDNLIRINGDGTTIQGEHGWASIEFEYYAQNMTPISGSSYQGLPVIGFQIQRLTNNNAQPGLLANYGRLFTHKGVTINN